MTDGPVVEYTVVEDTVVEDTAGDTAIERQPIALVDLLDRVLAGGVVLAGEITLTLADVDMVTISVRALVTSVSALAGQEQD